jgi:Zn-dependent protease
MRFSPFEVKHILLAVGAMTLAFSFATVGGIYAFLGALDEGGPVLIGIIVLSSFVAVITAFLLHELMHKRVAQRYGCYAEFRAYPMGLLLGVFTAAFGFMFAAPGAVMVSGQVSSRQHVRISAAGPATNLVLGAAFVGLAFLLGATLNPLASLVSYFVASIAFVNLFLGFFNLIPFPPLDGSKIFAFDKPLWVAMIAATAALYAVGWYVGVF